MAYRAGSALACRRCSWRVGRERTAPRLFINHFELLLRRCFAVGCSGLCLPTERTGSVDEAGTGPIFTGPATASPVLEVSHSKIHRPLGPKASSCRRMTAPGTSILSGGRFSRARTRSRPHAISSSTSSRGIRPQPSPARNMACFQPMSAVRNCLLDMNSLVPVA
jgi:hypothetical protein